MNENQHSSPANLRLARNLFPDLAHHVDAAYARYATGEPGAGSPAEADELDRLLDQRTAHLKQEGGALSGIAFAELPDPSSRMMFERVFAAVRTVSDWIKLPVPEPEVFEVAGVDFGHFATAMSQDASLLPVPAPHGLGAEQWQALFSHAATLPDSPVQAPNSQAQLGDRDASPLIMSSEVLRDFGLLDTVQNPETPVAVTTDAEGNRISWTIRLIPAGEKPETLGLSFAHGPHLSLPEMLMLQLIQIVTGGNLVDATCFTWISGVLGDGKLAARHVFDKADFTVRISCRELGNQGPHLGSRTPRT